MQLLSWLHKRLTGQPRTRRNSTPRQTAGFRPHLESLEGRIVPTFSAPVGFLSSQTVALIAGDINGDGHPDLISAGNNGNLIAVRLNNGNGTFGAAGLATRSRAVELPRRPRSPSAPTRASLRSSWRDTSRGTVPARRAQSASFSSRATASGDRCATVGLLFRNTSAQSLRSPGRTCTATARPTWWRHQRPADTCMWNASTA